MAQQIISDCRFSPKYSQFPPSHAHRKLCRKNYPLRILPSWNYCSLAQAYRKMFKHDLIHHFKSIHYTGRVNEAHGRNEVRQAGRHITTAVKTTFLFHFTDHISQTRKLRLFLFLLHLVEPRGPDGDAGLRGRGGTSQLIPPATPRISKAPSAR